MRSSTSILGAGLLSAALTAGAPLDLSIPATPHFGDGAVASSSQASDIEERGWGKGKGTFECTNLIVIFARGTTEIGPLGELVGPPYKEKIAQQLGGQASFSMYGVPAPAYPADIPGFLVGGSPTGSKAMAKMATKAVESCPKSKVVLSGYSQGGQVVHNACKALPRSITSRLGAVIFGDPDNGDPVLGVNPEKVKVICHPDDNICMHGDTILASHLTYGAIDANSAAAFTVAGTPAGRVKRQASSTDPSDGGDLYQAALDVPDSSLTPDADTPQRVPVQSGPPPTPAQFMAVPPPAAAAPPATNASPVPAAPAAAVVPPASDASPVPATAPVNTMTKDKRAPGFHKGHGGDYAGPQDVPSILNAPNLPAALSPVKRAPGGGYYDGPQDLPNLFNLPNLPAALSPEKRSPGGGYDGPQDLPNLFNLPNLPAALSPVKE